MLVFAIGPGSCDWEEELLHWYEVVSGRRAREASRNEDGALPRAPRQWAHRRSLQQGQHS